jgi:hypothetical protein
MAPEAAQIEHDEIRRSLDFYNSIETGTASFATGLCLMALSEAVKT